MIILHSIILITIITNFEDVYRIFNSFSWKYQAQLQYEYSNKMEINLKWMKRWSFY